VIQRKYQRWVGQGQQGAGRRWGDGGHVRVFPAGGHTINEEGRVGASRRGGVVGKGVFVGVIVSVWVCEVGESRRQEGRKGTKSGRQHIKN